MPKDMRTCYLTMAAATIVILCSLIIILTQKTINARLIPIPQQVPFIMEQLADIKRVEKIEKEMKELRGALSDMNERINNDNKYDERLSREKLEEISALWSKLNEINNRLPPINYYDGESSRRSRELFGK